MTSDHAQDQAHDDSQHQRFPTRSISDPAQIRALAIDAARMLSDDKCEDVLCLDVRALSQLSDYIIIGTGTSDRQMRSAADDIAKMAEGLKYPIFKRSQDDRATWIVLDCVDVVVHIFEPNTRAHYDLEMLWGDAEHVDWERPKPGEAKPAATKPASTKPAATKPAPAKAGPGKPSASRTTRTGAASKAPRANSDGQASAAPPKAKPSTRRPR